MYDTASEYRFSLMQIELRDSHSLIVVVETSLVELIDDSKTSRMTDSEDCEIVVLVLVVLVLEVVVIRLVLSTM